MLGYNKGQGDWLTNGRGWRHGRIQLKEKFAFLPKRTTSGRILWLKKYYQRIEFWDWPPSKVKCKTNLTLNEGLLYHISVNF
jgi:hypothetical protein